MKKTVFTLLLIFGMFSNVFAQKMEANSELSPQQLYDFHIKKKKTNNLAGWIALGGGAAMVIGGLGWNSSQGIVDGDSTNNNEGLWLSYLGGAVTLTSIPFFISAGKHKKKAKIQLQNGAVGLNREFRYNGLSFTFAF